MEDFVVVCDYVKFIFMRLFKIIKDKLKNVFG